MSVNSLGGTEVEDTDVCTHEYQCPNRLCQRVFASRRGLSMHFYHQDNFFCNPPERLRTGGEVIFPSHLPERLEPLSENSEVSAADDFGKQEDDSTPCWSVDGDESVSVGCLDGGPPSVVHVGNTAEPNIDTVNTKFGLSYTTAHVIETKLATMLNDIQAPKTMYASILQWGRDAYSQGYDFVPRHDGNKESLIASLQTQLHLEHFRPEKIKIKLPGDNLRVELSRFNFTKGLHSLLRHPDLTSNMENLDVNPLDPFGKYIAPNGRVGAVNSAQWYQNAYQTCIKDSTTDFMVPICFACDEAKLNGWPLMFSTTSFNQKLRNTSVA
jgi:hypothetical protein